MDEDHDMYMGNAKTLGLASFSISKLVPEQKQTLRLQLSPSLDNDLVKEDRGTLHIEVIIWTLFFPTACYGGCLTGLLVI